jgi:hypothetical protein
MPTVGLFRFKCNKFSRYFKYCNLVCEHVPENYLHTYNNFGHCQSSFPSLKSTFQRMHCPRLQVEPTLMGPISRANLRTETESVAFFNKTVRWIISRIVIVTSIYHSRKPKEPTAVTGGMWKAKVQGPVRNYARTKPSLYYGVSFQLMMLTWGSKLKLKSNYFKSDSETLS